MENSKKKNAHFTAINAEMNALLSDVIDSVINHGEQINDTFWYLPMNDKDFDTIYVLPLDVDEFREHLMVGLGVLKFHDELTLMAYYLKDVEAYADDNFYAMTNADVFYKEGTSMPSNETDYLEINTWGEGYWQQSLLNIAECLEWQEYI